MDASQGYALWRASQEGEVDVVQRILNKDPLNDFQQQPTTTNPVVVHFRGGDYKTTSLHEASERGHTEVIELLLSHGANIEVKDNNGWTPLILAGWEGQTEAMENLLRHGADVNAKNRFGDNTLIVASKKGLIKAMEVVLSHGADVNGRAGNGDTPLVGAIRNHRIGAVEVLLRHGAQVDFKVANHHRGTPCLVCAFMNWNTCLMEDWLLQQDRYYEKGETLLQWAMRNREYHFMDILLQNGMEIDARNNNGMTPLGWASQNKNARENGLIKSMEILLQHGAKVDAKDNNGLTPLALACQRGNAETVKVLLENGACVALKDQSGRSPLDHALLYVCSNHDKYGTRQGLSTVHLLLRSLLT